MVNFGNELSCCGVANSSFSLFILYYYSPNTKFKSLAKEIISVLCLFSIFQQSSGILKKLFIYRNFNHLPFFLFMFALFLLYFILVIHLLLPIFAQLTCFLTGFLLKLNDFWRIYSYFSFCWYNAECFKFSLKWGVLERCLLLSIFC